MATTADDLLARTHALGARREFADYHGSLITQNGFLKVALALAFPALVAQSVLIYRLETRALTTHPYIVRVDDVGNAAVVQYDWAKGHNFREPEVRRALGQFVIHHFSRIRRTVVKDFSDSLFFVSEPLAQSLGDPGRILKTYYKTPGVNDVEVTVNNVVLDTFDPAQPPPYKATVFYTLTHFSPNTRSILKTDKVTQVIEFFMADSVPETYWLVNPIGLQVLRYSSPFIATP